VALRDVDAMNERVAGIVAERDRVSARLGELPVTVWPSGSNFVLFRPEQLDGHEVWQRLLDRSVLIRDCSSWPRLTGCLRATIGTQAENDAFLDALTEALR
jgi:histidinol-phosphate aminotransferase